MTKSETGREIVRERERENIGPLSHKIKRKKNLGILRQV